MGDVKPLKPEFLNPTIVWQSFEQELPSMRSLYITGINKSGHPVTYSCGDLRDMSFALASMQHLLMKYFRGEVTGM